MTPEVIIRLENVAVRRDDQDILSVEQLEIVRGERVAFIGNSGSGKTTLMRLLKGYVKASRGNVEVLGASFANENANGLVLQLDRALFSPNANLGAREVSIEAMLEVPVVRRASAGARRVSVTEIFAEDY